MAEHFQKAGRPEKAVTYLTQAGDAAARVYANPEAIAYYRRAIDLTVEVGGDVEALTDLFIHLGRSLELNSQFEGALSVYEEMETVAHARGDRRMVLASLMARAKLRSMPVTAQYLIEDHPLSHAYQHLASIRAAVNAHAA